MNPCDIFLSFKFHDAAGNVTPEFTVAKELYGLLCKDPILQQQKINVFFCDESIVQAGSSDYQKVLDDNLESAKVMIVIASCPENCDDGGWVSYEWNSFYGDILSGRKKGALFSFLSDSVSNYPRKIRNNQFYAWGDAGRAQLLQSVRNFFINSQQAPSNKPSGSKKRASSYNYEVGDERNRLRVQAKLENRWDKLVIRDMVEKLNKECVYVLDVGCSMGDLTESVFKPHADKVNVLGVDKFQQCIDAFNERFAAMPNFSASLLDLDDNDWEQQLSQIMSESGIQKFDLIYCSMSLHHMADSTAVLKGLWKLLRDGGYIFIRTFDDGLKLAYPDPDNDVAEIIKLTSSIPGIADRYHGRKIYESLTKARFSDIKVENHCIDTIGKTSAERFAIFTNTFSWRQNYFVRYLQDSAARNKELAVNDALEKYNTVIKRIERVEERFASTDFYFAFFVTIVTARKEDFLSEND